MGLPRAGNYGHAPPRALKRNEGRPVSQGAPRENQTGKSSGVKKDRASFRQGRDRPYECRDPILNAADAAGPSRPS